MSTLSDYRKCLFTRTDSDGPSESEEEQRLIEGLPLKGVGLPDEMAYDVGFFLNEQVGFITGKPCLLMVVVVLVSV